jgi:hypothetical protein
MRSDEPRNGGQKQRQQGAWYLPMAFSILPAFLLLGAVVATPHSQESLLLSTAVPTVGEGHPFDDLPHTPSYIILAVHQRHVDDPFLAHAPINVNSSVDSWGLCMWIFSHDWFMTIKQLCHVTHMTSIHVVFVCAFWPAVGGNSKQSCQDAL